MAEPDARVDEDPTAQLPPAITERIVLGHIVIVAEHEEAIIGGLGPKSGAGMVAITALGYGVVQAFHQLGGDRLARRRAGLFQSRADQLAAIVLP